MPTIVQYRTDKPPRNLYPRRIVSPPRSSPCCWSSMEPVGEPQDEGRWRFQYRRCRTCGFTVRVILAEIPDAELETGLRRFFETALDRS